MAAHPPAARPIIGWSPFLAYERELGPRGGSQSHAKEFAEPGSARARARVCVGVCVCVCPGLGLYLHAPSRPRGAGATKPRQHPSRSHQGVPKSFLGDVLMYSWGYEACLRMLAARARDHARRVEAVKMRLLEGRLGRMNMRLKLRQGLCRYLHEDMRIDRRLQVIEICVLESS